MNQQEEDALVAETIGKLKTLWNDDKQCIREAIRAAVAHERERAAKVCEQMYPEIIGGEEVMLPCFDDVRDCAAAIRRGE